MDFNGILRKMKLHLPQLVDYQQKIFIKDKARTKVIAAGTKVGKTFGCSSWILNRSSSMPETLHWWVAPVKRLCKISMDLITKILRQSPEYYSACKISKTDLTIILPNKAIIEYRSGFNPDILRGDNVHSLVLEECAILKEAAWDNASTTLSVTQGDSILISWPQGRNWFYREWRKGMDYKTKPGKRAEYSAYRIPSTVSKFITPQEIELARKKLPTAVFKEKYLALFSEGTSRVFPNFINCIGGKREPPKIGHEYVIGLDIGKSTSYTVYIVIDINRNVCVDWKRFQTNTYSEIADIVKEAAVRFNNALIVSDKTGVGNATHERLCNIYPRDKIKPILFNRFSKQDLMNKLLVFIEQGFIGFPPEFKQLYVEMEDLDCRFTKAGNVIYEARSEGGYTDCIMALALGISVLNEMPANWEGKIIPPKREKSISPVIAQWGEDEYEEPLEL